MGESGYGRFPVTEDMVIGALLHDAVEDEGGLPRLRDIDVSFGKEVAKTVEGCTDSFEEDSRKKLEWEVRKKSYIDRPFGRSRREPRWFQQRTNYTTPAQFLRITETSGQKFGADSNAIARNSFGISTNSSRFMNNDARIGES
jgi:hypothetical protein